jgi:hypothetical protein
MLINFNLPVASKSLFSPAMSFFSQKCALVRIVAVWLANRAFALPTSNAASTDAAAVFGDATFYGGNTGGGMCSFTGYTLPSGTYGTAMSSSNWNQSEICGACISVIGPKGRIRALVRTISSLRSLCPFPNVLKHKEGRITSIILALALTSLRARPDHRPVPKLWNKSSRPVPRCFRSHRKSICWCHSSDLVCCALRNHYAIACAQQVWNFKVLVLDASSQQ